MYVHCYYINVMIVTELTSVTQSSGSVYTLLCSNSWMLGINPAQFGNFMH